MGKIRDQGYCNSCWAFSAGYIVEYIMKKRNMTLVSSPQQLVDCCTSGCTGCKSGWPKQALDYVKVNGITNEMIYPYKGVNQSCTYNRLTQLKGFVNQTAYINTAGNETLLR